MPFDLSNAVVYDVEVLPNCFTLTMELLYSDVSCTWEISEFRDDRVQLMQWFNYLHQSQIGMIGFNNIGYDYPIIHFIYSNPNCSYADIYAKNQAMFSVQDSARFAHTIWDRDRFAPQIDLYKIHHFDNPAKRTSLKALQINMRWPNVMESPVQFGTWLTEPQVNVELIPYNYNDVGSTKKFAVCSRKAIEFRVGLIDRFGIDVLNYNDTKIGAKMLEQQIGEEYLYDRSSGRKVMRQTIRHRIALADCIAPYIYFNNTEFQRVLEYLKAQTLTPEDITDATATVQTKGVFKGLHADVGGITFKFGTGGIHGSVERQRFVAGNGWRIRDIDVGGMYPRIMIVNQLEPEHLKGVFLGPFSQIPEERAKYAKGTVENGTYKLGGNAAYGNSNNKHSPFLDPMVTMKTTINGQLMLCMLAERLAGVPTLKLIQANTDGITYFIHDDFEPMAAAICKEWEAYTCLNLEDAEYSRMFIRDVNSYIAETTKGKLKIKGAYWTPDPLNYDDSISEAGPPAWHKNWGAAVIQRAAVAAMVHNIPPETFIRCCTDPFDFMLKVKVDKSARLELGGVEIQRTTRYYVSHAGLPMVKVSPPPAGHNIGEWKRAPKISKFEYDKVMAETGGEWDARVCTKAKTKFTNVSSNIEAGWMVRECNVATSFNFADVNYDYYIAEARKLIIN